jgi:hypothetical protein
MLLAMVSNIRHLQLHNSLLETERNRLVIVNFVRLRRAGLAEASLYTLKPSNCPHPETFAVKAGKFVSLTQTEKLVFLARDT